MPVADDIRAIDRRILVHLHSALHERPEYPEKTVLFGRRLQVVERSAYSVIGTLIRTSAARRSPTGGTLEGEGFR